MHKVTEVGAVKPYGLKVRFRDGSHGVHDCSGLVAETGPMIEPLKNPEYFALVHLEFGAPTWPNGYDMCPDWLNQEMAAAGELLQDAAE